MKKIIFSILNFIPWDALLFVILILTSLGFTIEKLIENSNLDDVEAFKVKSEKGIAKVVDIGCLQRDDLRLKEIKSGRGIVRIRGFICDDDKNKLKDTFLTINIKNKTNNYQGTVFQNDDSFLSDYVVLKGGKNLIEVTWKSTMIKDKKGRLTAEIFHE